MRGPSLNFRVGARLGVSRTRFLCLHRRPRRPRARETSFSRLANTARHRSRGLFGAIALTRVFKSVRLCFRRDGTSVFCFLSFWGVGRGGELASKNAAFFDSKFVRRVGETRVSPAAHPRRSPSTPRPSRSMAASVRCVVFSPPARGSRFCLSFSLSSRGGRA